MEQNNEGSQTKKTWSKRMKNHKQKDIEQKNEEGMRASSFTLYNLSKPLHESIKRNYSNKM